jgi:hypothetical protein
MRDDIDFATLVKHQMASCIGMVEELDPALWQFFQQHGVLTGEKEQFQFASGTLTDTMTMRPGAKYRPAPGYKLKDFNPNSPSPQYFEHIRVLLTYMAVNLDLPLIILLLDASDTTFSSYRHVLNQARDTFKVLRERIVEQWHRPVWNTLVRHWAFGDPVLKRFIERGGNEEGMRRQLTVLRRHWWNHPTYEYIEPVKDGTGDVLKLGHCLTSFRRFAAGKHSEEWPVLANEIVDDRYFGIRLACLRANELNAEFGPNTVHWRDLLPLPTAETSISLTGTLDDPTPKPANQPQEATA